MKKYICHFALVSISCFAVDHNVHLLDNNPEITKTVEDLLLMMKVPGAAIGIVKDGKTVLARGYGMRSLESNLPVTAKTIFPVGSITKPFTSFVIGQLVDKEILSWDSPLSAYIPHFRLKDPYTTYQITLRDLLTHTSGYPSHEAVWYNQTFSRSEIVRKFQFLDPIYQLREKFYYQNLGFTLAGHAAEVAMNKSYEALVEENILKPLGMSHSTFSLSEMLKTENHTLSYDDLETPFPFINAATITPAGGLHSNIDDLLKWAKLLLNKGEGFIDPSTFNELIKPQVVSDLICNGRYGLDEEITMESYGLGWILLSYQGHFLAMHGGNINGCSSLLLFLPNDDLAIIVLSNKHISPFPFVVASTLIDNLLDLPPIDWAEKYETIARVTQEEYESKKKTENDEKNHQTFPSHLIDDYVGTYSNPGYGPIEITLVAGNLVAKYNHLHFPLDHWNYNVFEISRNSSFSILKGVRFTFQENSHGDIKYLTIPLEPKLPGLLFTKQADSSLNDQSYLDKFSGKYSYLGFTILIEVINDKLVVKAFGQPPYELYPEKLNVFHVKNLGGYVIEFIPDDSGSIVGVKLTEPDNTTYAANKIDS